MATYTDNYQLTKPTYAEQADIGVINSNMNKIDNVMHSSQISLAPAYDQSQTYAEGDVVMYELLMYKCISPTTGVWDGSKWERTTASESGGGGSAELDILGEASGAVASFADGASAGLAKCIAEIVPKQAGTGTPSPDNVRAISGYTAVKVDVAGKNLLPTTNTETVDGVTYTPQADGSVKVVGTSTGTRAKYIWLNGKLPSDNYILSAGNEVTANGVRLTCGITRAGGNVQYYDCTSSAEKPFSFYDDDQSISVYMRTNGGSTAINATVYPMIRLASEADATFEPYKGSTTTTPLGQTVYGGQLNVLTGELTIDRQIVDLGSLTWARTDNSIIDVGYWFHANITGKRATGETINSNYRTAPYKSVTTLVEREGSAVDYVAVEAGGEVGYRIIDSRYTDATAFKTAMSGVQMCYFLASPQTVQLTPQEVNSLLGQNNISADTGDIEVVYVKASAPIQPNPTGTPTATLKKLGIEGTVFELEGGGGGSSLPFIFDSTERVVGSWFGKPLYAQTWDFGSNINVNSNAWTTTTIPNTDMEGIVFAVASNDNNGRRATFPISANCDSRSYVQIMQYRNATITTRYVTLLYTKITD